MISYQPYFKKDNHCLMSFYQKYLVRLVILNTFKCYEYFFNLYNDPFQQIAGIGIIFF